MMPVFLTVLKITGIVLLSLLALLLLILLILLFVPVRYCLKGDINADEKHFDMGFDATWLLHIIHAKAGFLKTEREDPGRKREEGFSYEIRLFGFKIRPKKEKAPVIDEGGYELTAGEEEYQNIETGIEDSGSSAEPAGVEDAVSTAAVEEKDILSGTVDREAGDQSAEDEFSEEIPKGFKEKLKDFALLLKGMGKKARQLKENARCKIRGIYDNISEVSGKVRYYYELLDGESSREAIELILHELCRILKAIKPRKYRLNMIYGFEDVSLTGEATGLLAVLFSGAGRNAVFIPDFDRQTIQGDFFFRGRIRLLTIVIVLWRLYFNKNFRRFFKEIRNG